MSKFHALTWLLFAVTAFVAAIIIPVHIFFVEILPHLGFADTNSYDYLYNLLKSSLVKIYMFILISSAIYHGFYRFKAVICDIGILKHSKNVDIITLIISLIFILFLGIFLILI